MRLPHQDQGENLEDHHQQECRRSAPQYAATKLVLRGNLKNLHDHHECRELECPRSARQTATAERNKTRQSALPPTVPPVHKTLRDSVLRDLGHCDNLLGDRSVELLQHFHQFVPHLRHRHIENLHEEQDVDDVLHGVPLYPPPAAAPQREVSAAARLQARHPQPHQASSGRTRRLNPWEEESSGAWRSASRSLPPFLPWLSLGSEERCTTQAQHHECDEGLLPGPLAERAVRAASASLADAGGVSTLLLLRDRHAPACDNHWAPTKDHTKRVTLNCRALLNGYFIVKE